MANANAPFGFRVLRSKSGGPSYQTNGYPIATGYSTALYYGDAVKTAGDGTLAAAAAGDAIVGIFQGVSYTDTTGAKIFRKHWTASTTATQIMALVADDPNLVLEAQSSGSMTSADIGQFCNLDAGTAGSATTGMSGMQSSATGGSESQFRILGVYGVDPYQKIARDSAGNTGYSATGTNAVVLLTIAKHEMGGSAIGVEV